MAFRRQASRLRFREYLCHLKTLRARGEAAAGIGPHGRTFPTTPRQRTFLTLLAEFWRLLGANRAAVAVSLFTLTLATLLKLVPPAATKLTVDYVLGSTPWPPAMVRLLPSQSRYQLLTLLVVAVVLVSAIDSLISVWGRWRATQAAKRMQVDMRRRVFQHAVQLPLHRVYELKSGGITSLLRDDAGGVSELIFSLLYNPWRAIVQLTGSLLVLAWVDWRLLLGSLILLPTVYYTHRTWIHRIRPLHRDIRRQRQDVDSHATEAFAGMRVVRAFGRQQSETARYTFGNDLQARQELLAWWWARGVELVWETLLPLASAALMWYGGRRVLDGSLTLGDLTMFLAYVAMLLGPLAVLANTATQLQNNLAGLDRVLDLLAEPRELDARPATYKLTRREVAGAIELRDVSFRYPKSRDLVLQDIDLDVQAGQNIALVGPSGAGKTTLCNLVARFYDPTSGSVTLDGRDLRDIDLASYRRLLGIVEQDIFLFDGTIAQNIGYAVRHATPEAVRHAAELAHAHEFISELEHGYETIIGERGVRLSGGQRQRIAIARAVLADPKILILDEATSNLDTESERLIQDSLEGLLRERTSFVIAHRLSTITRADRILLIDHGQIVAQGTHESLYQESAQYRRMVQLQIGTPIDSYP